MLDTEDLLLRWRPGSANRRSRQSAAQQSHRFAEWLKEKYKERGGHAATLPTPSAQGFPRTLPPMMA